MEDAAGGRAQAHGLILVDGSEQINGVLLVIRMQFVTYFPAKTAIYAVDDINFRIEEAFPVSRHRDTMSGADGCTGAAPAAFVFVIDPDHFLILNSFSPLSRTKRLSLLVSPMNNVLKPTLMTQLRPTMMNLNQPWSI